MNLHLEEPPVRRTKRNNVREIRKPIFEMEQPNGLLAQLAERVVGQSHAMSTIVPYVQMHQSGLAPEGRPLGVFLLLGPTGTGKTHMVEALAEVLHGSRKNVLKVDCGEFQMEHEVAKLIGAPPGYLGHRETHPMLTQAKLGAVASEKSDISIVLFDEVEKAAPSLTRLLLGILDKATLRLGDNNTVNFEKALIFLTSNLGATGMMKAMSQDFGLGGAVAGPCHSNDRFHAITQGAVRRQFSPEFINRVDASVTFRPLSKDSLRHILDQQLTEMQTHILRRLGPKAFTLVISEEAREFLLAEGTSVEYGAREIKRTLHRRLMQPLAALVANGKLEGCKAISADLDEETERVTLCPAA